MKPKEVKREIRLREWAEMIDACQQSGKTVKTWCAEQNLTLNTYFYRQKQVRERFCKELTAGAMPSSLVPEPSSAIEFVELRENPNSPDISCPAIQIQAQGVQFDVYQGATPELLDAVLKAIL